MIVLAIYQIGASALLTSFCARQFKHATLSACVRACILWYKTLIFQNQSDSSGDDERFHDREAEELVKRLEEKYVSVYCSLRLLLME